MKSWLANQFRNSPSLYSAWLAYLRLSVREQVLVFILMVLVFIVSIYLTVWRPAQIENDNAHNAFENAVADYYTLVENVEHLQTFSSGPVSSLQDRSANELRALVNRTARQYGIVAERISLDGDSRLQIWVKDAAFSTLSPWITELAKEETRIDSMQWSSQKVGRVDLKMTLD
ncbi:type II secretion system protein GspM [Marinomonas sp. 2405UD68-3]|uniref:type II secretion system protein GspM n=1 Tax=Marinomonas sp. 2405UD68-3 TaxID=3391835 RepID=UPI0039C9673C